MEEDMVAEPTTRVEEIRELLPEYETDLSAIGTNRTVDPDLIDDRPWHEVHDLTQDEVQALVEEK